MGVRCSGCGSSLDRLIATWSEVGDLLLRKAVHPGSGVTAQRNLMVRASDQASRAADQPGPVPASYRRQEQNHTMPDDAGPWHWWCEKHGARVKSDERLKTITAAALRQGRTFVTV
jgi:hypothetical protein